MEKMTLKDYYASLKHRKDFTRFQGFETIYNYIIKLYPNRKNLIMTDNNNGTFIETLITGKIKDNNPAGDIKNVDIKTFTTKTGCHYNHNTSDNKRYLKIFISKNVVIKLSDYIIPNEKDLKRGTYQDNINIGLEMSLNEMLEFVASL